MKIKNKFLTIALLFILSISTNVYSSSISKELMDGYTSQINQYMERFIVLYSDDALEGTQNLKIESAENSDDGLTILRYFEEEKLILRYKFFYSTENANRYIDYYIISPKLIYISDVVQVNSSEYMSSRMNDILYTNVSKYLVIDGKLYRYAPDFQLATIEKNTDLFLTIANLDKNFTSVLKSK
ncbi:MAG: hypothetical protein LBT51_02935 [Fusobacteriaceae bacterium]|jgi:hypothetical protein|nr:hypothetical protein [Fusobacteriaceae bacterium]